MVISLPSVLHTMYQPKVFHGKTREVIFVEAAIPVNGWQMPLGQLNQYKPTSCGACWAAIAQHMAGTS